MRNDYLSEVLHAEYKSAIGPKFEIVIVHGILEGNQIADVGGHIIIEELRSRIQIHDPN